MKRSAALVIAAVLSASGPALAVNPSEQLDDPRLEARARDLAAELRCLVCQNQSIDESEADLAKDLRLLVRERLVAGDTDEAVLAYITDRYGNFVLLKPPVTGSTLILWAAPAVIALIALVGAGFYVRGRRKVAGAEQLSEEEEAEVAAILAKRH
ncbi:cytochrome c-type biogenesis protein [Acuticoccus mangrovi]|uniref:Cytochrome c-type biogenesis protein n=1 Tax=Acuticoccus mangrovi TaxID=2796142 RepID=A0A934IM43_9HYPH|nr:cytochrome c-type biogenesis protein [Acuticoccus mangrovi]MBJ3774757.1 cytochrome c-type biogenesis protein CcmH [Acuticoccus mangrovi]